ncbi:MAG: hypothetical protein HC921_11365 [Synechococcaceae cyanobacterium SM2_3_1]|nr:hypothetical protein [Synechococcaceae cyanobacterium SM2_3_1]
MTAHFVHVPAAKSAACGWHPFRSLITFIKNWLDRIEIQGICQARWICRLIPSHCPFERDILLGSRTIHIPALCRINPVYEQLIGLRMRAASYLVEVNS